MVYILKKNLNQLGDCKESFGLILQNLKLISVIRTIQTCKDQLWLEPRIGMNLGPKSPNNKFVESGRKN